MIRKSFSLEQATTFCNDYQFLKGNIFDKEKIGMGIIECVAIAPFDESKQWLFAQYYRETKNPVKALQFYNGKEFDVILMALPMLRKRGIHFMDLRSYLYKNNIFFNQARYELKAPESVAVPYFR